MDISKKPVEISRGRVWSMYIVVKDLISILVLQIIFKREEARLSSSLLNIICYHGYWIGHKIWAILGPLSSLKLLFVTLFII
jgi:hypothetical protein